MSSRGKWCSRCRLGLLLSDTSISDYNNEKEEEKVKFNFFEYCFLTDPKFCLNLALSWILQLKICVVINAPIIFYLNIVCMLCLTNLY